MSKSEYIYLIDLDEYLLCRNLAKANCIISPFLIHYKTYKKIHPIYYLDLNKVLFDKKESQIGFSSPRFYYITLANWYNNGLKIGYKENNKFHLYSENEINKILRVAQIEIEFEKIRRKINPLLPSRLSSIFLANDDFDGRTMLKNMFFNRKKNFIIEKVKITHKFLFFKADYRWIVEYEKEKEEIYIYKYWLGENYDSIPSYEYLLEGRIELLSNEGKTKVIEALNNFS